MGEETDRPEGEVADLSLKQGDIMNDDDVPVQDGTEAGPNYSDDADEATRLAALGAGTRDQDDLERDIGRQADALLTEQADERDNKRLDKTRTDKARLLGQVRRLEGKLNAFGSKPVKDRYRAEIAHYEAQIKTLDQDTEQILKRIESRHQGEEGYEAPASGDGNQKQPGESQREFLIRTGKITPFSKMGKQMIRQSSDLADVMFDAEQEDDDEGKDSAQAAEIVEAQRSHRNLIKPGFEDVNEEDQKAIDNALAEFADERPTKRRRIQTRHEAQQKPLSKPKREEDFSDDSEDAYMPKSEGGESEEASDAPVDEEDDAAIDMKLSTPGIKRRRRGKQLLKADTDREDLAGIDDGNEHVYQSRLESWSRRRRAARKRAKEITDKEESDEVDAEADGEDEEWHLPHPTRSDTEFEGGFKIPGDIYPSLFDYQKTGVQWLWELFSQQVGGIVGDEMGLGKTIQIVSFIAGLHYSKKLTKPVIVVCPATVMKQWVNEFHQWWPALRVSILHTSGSGMLDLKRENSLEDDLEMRDFSGSRSSGSKGSKAAKRIVNRVQRDGHILVTTYSGLQTYADLLIPIDWEYAVLDEGHKIRNPNTAITIYCKELRTHNRIILSGTPMQNNLTELWSLFDFVFPMRLGTLVNFRQQFEFPIKQGGYANASNLQVETAMKCAETLKDTISPYLLQRFKIDVASDLPKKSERVLFCKLTKLQRDAYEFFLESEEMKSIMAGKRQALYGVDILRKICNHPDLTEHKTLSVKEDYNYGNPGKSGKMQVVKALLEIWKKNGHKTLLFAQHRIMLDILQSFVANMPGFRYCRMDGNTPIKDRQDLVDEFNRNPDLHVFLLTTKVGGLGVNLTGADRVIIYDPDWNPSTDVQARERAWRLGQKREVEIYRLMTAGTIEEKIYHRQIFKQFLTNKILKDPKQRQTFQMRDLHDLFTLGDANEGETETGTLFRGTEVQFNKPPPAASTTPNAPADSASLPTPPTDSSDTSTIVGISHSTDFRDPTEEDTPTADPATGEVLSRKDDRIMSTLFARSGVTSALSHDEIINGPSARPLHADEQIIAREAKRVAAAAARELQKAGEQARSVAPGTVTWTGVYGSGGRPSSPAQRGGGIGSSTRGRGGFGSASRGGAGPSSAGVLANLASRQGLTAPAGTSSSLTGARFQRTATPASGSASEAEQQPHHQPKGREFIALIRDYLMAHGGKVYTKMLIDHFNRYCGTPQRTAEFKEMLKRIAYLEKGEGGQGGRGGRLGARGVAGRGTAEGRGKWVLKEEYRPKTGGGSGGVVTV
ncbi:putative DNA repair protein rhp26 [Elsinoe australis]|uniref:Putative DNA repair protein rhp26 n=1 Tax=Elsinoe australis TaxID=40998 RepID=A0A4V6DUZ4_9PEZI|nr:putative DNA repair protein rhp26 [Elsinoe australis]